MQAVYSPASATLGCMYRANGGLSQGSQTSIAAILIPVPLLLIALGLLLLLAWISQCVQGYLLKKHAALNEHLQLSWVDPGNMDSMQTSQDMLETN